MWLKSRQLAGCFVGGCWCAVCRGEVVAYKAILAADTGALSAKSKKVAGKSALQSGRYTFHWESSTPIGTPETAATERTTTKPGTSPARAWKFQECLDACDAEPECMAAGMTKVTKAAATLTLSQADAQALVDIGSCRLVMGVMSAGVGKRSVTKVKLSLLSLPDAPAAGEHLSLCLPVGRLLLQQDASQNEHICNLQYCWFFCHAP
jgi:hypothetical protein